MFNSSEDLIYGVVIIGSVFIGVLYYKYTNYKYNLSISRELDTIRDLLEYKQQYLEQVFSSVRPDSIPDNFLNSPISYHFFLNLIKICDINIFMMFLDTNDKYEFLKFVEVIKEGDFEKFSKHKISKNTLYRSMYAINKYIFRLDLE